MNLTSNNAPFGNYSAAIYTFALLATNSITLPLPIHSVLGILEIFELISQFDFFSALEIENYMQFTRRVETKYVPISTHGAHLIVVRSRASETISLPAVQGCAKEALLENNGFRGRGMQNDTQNLATTYFPLLLTCCL